MLSFLQFVLERKYSYQTQARFLGNTKNLINVILHKRCLIFKDQSFAWNRKQLNDFHSLLRMPCPPHSDLSWLEVSPNQKPNIIPFCLVLSPGFTRELGGLGSFEREVPAHHKMVLSSSLTIRCGTGLHYSWLIPVPRSTSILLNALEN